MSFDIIHEEFTLKVNHLIPDEDVRHRNYFKMLPKQKRTDLKFEFKEGSLLISIFWIITKIMYI